MADLLTPELFDRLLWAVSGASIAALVITINRPSAPNRRRWQRLEPSMPLDSPELSSEARKAAREAVAAWRQQHGPMSDLQTARFVVEVLSADAHSSRPELLELRRSVIALALRAAKPSRRPQG